MILLPRRLVDQVLCRLPMADRSAALLMELVLAPGLEGGAARLGKAMADDPPLVMWTLAAAQDHRVELHCLSQVAQWLLREAAAVFVWSEDDPLQINLAYTQAQRYRRLVQASAEAALAATALRGEQILSDPAYLQGLTRNQADWVAASACVNAVVNEPVEALLSDTQTLTKESNQAIGCEIESAAAQAGERWAKEEALAGQFPALLARLRRWEALEISFCQALETEKLESLAEFAAGAGHEINNPLAVISGRVQLLLQQETDPERRRQLAVINTQAMRVYEMIADLMLFARPPAPALAEVMVDQLVAQIIDELQVKADLQGTELRVAGRCDKTITADGTQLLIALRAVCDNALQAVGSQGRIEISAAPVDFVMPSLAGPRYSPPSVGWPGGAGVRITIADNGPGLSAEVRRHLFDPYFSGRGAGRGLGLGLAKCWRIVRNHGGSVEVASTPGAGATFIITLPRVHQAGAPLRRTDLA